MLEIAKIRVDGIFADVVERSLIPSNLAGGCIRVEYAPGIWDGLTKTVVFKCVTTKGIIIIKKDVITNETVIEIPPETIALPNTYLNVGFFGVDEQRTLIVPTLWANLGMILPGTDPSGDTSTDPSLPVWAQLADQIKRLEESGVVVDPEEIQKIVDEYLAENPPSGGNVENGEDGFSPIAKVEQTASGAVISITDKDGTTTATITNGKDGTDGAPGEKGDKGDKGDPGEPGQKGEQGEQGIQGIPGEKGEKGDTGAPGADGVKGDKGDKGDTGETGAQGEPGKDGANGVTPHIGSNGNWYIGDTDTGKPSRGADGRDGEPGKDGAAGSPGKDGNGIKSAVLNADYTLTLMFDDGTTYTTPSIRGATGATGSTGQTGATGAAGKDGTSVTVKSVSESTADGGSNVVTFSDGKTLTVKNGRAGKDAENPDAVPDYVVTEAEAVIDRLITAQGNRTFNLAVLTDFHKGRNNYHDDVLHACQATEYIGKRIKLDAVAVLGDYTDLYLDADYANAIPDYKDVNSLLSSLRFAPNLRQSGNHDFHKVNSPVVHSYVHGFSDGVTWGEKLGGYYYRDFAEYKLRVISVNTNEIDGGHIACSDEQYQWFADSLDLSEKEDASEWQILILSHHPLDWYTIDSTYRFGPIIKAYTEGTAWSSGNISCNFSGKNSARIIANIHGHLHNLLTGKIHIGNASNSDEIDVVRMCMPEVSAGGGNTYEGVWKEETTYAKTQNTAKDTSVTICCIDLDTYTINAVCYGAGYDRTVVYYDPAKPKYKNMLEYAINSDKTPYRGTNGEIGYKTGVRIKSDGSETAQNGADYCVTGFIPVKDWDYIYLKNMNFIVDVLENQPNTRFATYTSDFIMKRNCTSSVIMSNNMFNGHLLDENGGTLETGDAVGKFRLHLEDGTAYIRFSTKKIDDTSIVTINEPITT